MLMAHFANNQVVPWNGEKRKPYGMGKPVPHLNSVCIPINLPKSLRFVPSTAVGEDAGGDEYTEQFWCRYLKCLVPTMLQKTMLQKAEELSRASGRPGCVQAWRAMVAGCHPPELAVTSVSKAHVAELYCCKVALFHFPFPLI